MPSRRLKQWIDRIPSPVRRTLELSRQHRASALAAEVAFFAILSVPPLLVGLVATGGLVAKAMGPETVTTVTDYLLQLSGNMFSADVTERLVKPSINEVLTRSRLDALSLGYALAIWSGSRMINAVYQSVEILSEQDSHRSSVQTRLRSIKTLILGLLAVTIALPLMLAGPRLLASLLPWYFNVLAWFGVALITVLAVAWILREAIPKSPPWRLAISGGAAIMIGWVVMSVLLQVWIARTTSQASLYGPLAAPIALLLWLQLMAMVFLLGATWVAATLARAGDSATQ